jgi:hypothetical protein
MVFSQLWTLAGIHIDAGPLKSVAVVLRHPIGGFALQLCRMLLQLGQIIERVRATQFAGVNETHEDRPYERHSGSYKTTNSLILSMTNSFL